MVNILFNVKRCRHLSFLCQYILFWLLFWLKSNFDDSTKPYNSLGVVFLFFFLLVFLIGSSGLGDQMAVQLARYLNVLYIEPSNK